MLIKQQSDLGLHCLPRFVCHETYVHYDTYRASTDFTIISPWWYKLLSVAEMFPQIRAAIADRTALFRRSDWMRASCSWAFCFSVPTVHFSSLKQSQSINSHQGNGSVKSISIVAALIYKLERVFIKCLSLKRGIIQSNIDRIL